MSYFYSFLPINGIVSKVKTINESSVFNDKIKCCVTLSTRWWNFKPQNTVSYEQFRMFPSKMKDKENKTEKDFFL